jgi:hypothetical protein
MDVLVADIMLAMLWSLVYICRTCIRSGRGGFWNDTAHLSWLNGIAII